MKRALVRVCTASIILGIAGGAAWYGMLSFGRKERRALDPPPAIVIHTGTPTHRDFKVIEPWIGSVESARRVTVVATEEGRLLSIDVEDETPVEKGSVLFTLGGPRLDTRLEATKENIRSLQQQLTIVDQLVERKKSIIKQMIGKQAELETAQVQRLSLGSQLKTAASTLQQLENATHLVAPLAGIFTKRGVSVGQDVSQGELLGEVIDPTHVRVIATLFPPGDATIVGRPAIVRAAGSARILGTVTRVLPQRTRAGGTVVWLEGNALDQHLRPGERVGGEVVLATHENALAVPDQALVRDRQETAFVFVSHGTDYEKREVQTGLTTHGWIEILSGIEPEETIVVLGAYGLYHQDFSDIYKVVD